LRAGPPAHMICPMNAHPLRTAACLAAAALTVLLIAAPAGAQAPPTLASVFATDNVFTAEGGGPANVTVATGGHVNFSYFSGNSRHNVVFTAAKPTVCGISSGPAGNADALPSSPSPRGWEGGCDFQAAGTYPFVCGLHSNMTGSVTVVQGSGSPPPGPPPVVEAPAVIGAAATGLTVAARQRGITVRGSVRVRRSGSRLLARAFARRSALVVSSRSAQLVQVGRQSRTSLGAGRVSFSAKLNAAGRRALRRNGRLAITLRITVTPAEGRAYTATRTVVLRPAT
jgi:plastocyanin